MTDEMSNGMDGRAAAEPVTPEPEHDRHGIELMAAILLGLAALLTAYAAYYGSLADGDSLEGYTSSQRTTAEANGFYGDYSQTYTGDQQLFLQYKIKLEEGDDALAQDIRDTLFSTQLEAATVAWEQQTDDDPNAGATPLDRPEYVVQAYQDYVDTAQLAEDQFDEAKNTNEQGDNLGLAQVFLAVSLFAAGIAALFKIRTLSISLLIASAVLIVPGVWAIAKGKGWIS